jgi:hypothetical protein
MLFSQQIVPDKQISSEERKQPLKRMFMHVSDNNSGNGGNYLHCIAIRSIFI